MNDKTLDTLRDELVRLAYEYQLLPELVNGIEQRVKNPDEPYSPAEDVLMRAISCNNRASAIHLSIGKHLAKLLADNV